MFKNQWEKIRDGKYFKFATPYLFILPAIMVMGFVLIYPMFYSLSLSFFNWSAARPFMGKTFIGFNNFIRAFQDSNFLISIRNTILITFSSVGLELILGIGVALLLNDKFKGKTIFQTILFMPVVFSYVSVAVLWRIILVSEVGFVPNLALLFGIDNFTILSDKLLALISIILVNVWRNLPFAFTLTLAGLKSISNEPYEAAIIDGANKRQIFRFITLPLLKPVLVVIIIIRTIDAFRLFDLVYILTNGGPNGATETVSTYTVKIAFQYFNTGYASALSYIIFGLVLIISLFYLKILKTDIF